MVFSKNIVEFLKLLRSVEIIAEIQPENTNTNTFEYLNKHNIMLLLLTVPDYSLRFNLEGKLPLSQIEG